jgi:hypothetical protein
MRTKKTRSKRKLRSKRTRGFIPFRALFAEFEKEVKEVMSMAIKKYMSQSKPSHKTVDQIAVDCSLKKYYRNGLVPIAVAQFCIKNGMENFNSEKVFEKGLDVLSDGVNGVIGQYDFDMTKLVIVALSDFQHYSTSFSKKRTEAYDKFFM